MNLDFSLTSPKKPLDNGGHSGYNIHCIYCSQGMNIGNDIPFSINRNDSRSLVDQVADGLRHGIVSGRWRVGDEIPSTRELAPMLGVSRIVTKAALSRLAAEGYVLARHGLKPVVCNRGEEQWRHSGSLSRQHDGGRCPSRGQCPSRLSHVALPPIGQWLCGAVVCR